MSDKGLEQFVLEQAESVKFADPAVRDGDRQGAEGGRGQSRARFAGVAAHLQGRGETHAARRLSRRGAGLEGVLSAGARPGARRQEGALQGWATLENLSGQDWSGVDLTLVSGRPVAYKQALYRAYMIDRPEAPVDVGEKLTPGVDRGGDRGGRPRTQPSTQGAVRSAALADLPTHRRPRFPWRRP